MTSPITTNYFSTQSWVVPQSCHSIDTFDCTGGGGNGTAGQGTQVFNGYRPGVGGVGGGGGARAIKRNIAVTPGETLTIYVGTAGGYSGLYRNSTNAWLCLAYSGSGSTGGGPSVYDTGYAGGNGGGTFTDPYPDYYSNPRYLGGAGGGSQSYGGGGASGVAGGRPTADPGWFANDPPYNGGDGGNGTNYGGGGGGGGGGSTDSNFFQYAGGAGGVGFHGISTLTYTPILAPNISSVSPNTGTTAGGLSVVITGISFIDSVSMVTFGGFPSPGFTVDSTTQITAITPQHTVGTVDIRITNTDGTSPIVAADQFTYVVTVWPDTGELDPTTNVVAAAGVMRAIRARLTSSAVAGSDITTPQQFISVGLSPAVSFAPITIGQPKSLFSRLTVGTGLTAISGASKFTGAVSFQPATTVKAFANQLAGIKTKFTPVPILRPSLSQKQILKNFAKLSASALLAQPFANLPEVLRVRWTIGSGLVADIQKVHFLSAALDVQVGISPTITLEPLQWISYGSELLYASASGLEKAMIDADAPRLTQINAEVIIDTWDPYNCPLPLLPYLAWEMGITFWNDAWSDQTKRGWIAAQWQFKALRGTDAAISMAVDYAGRDISPYGYRVRSILTAPQGQYPSPGTTPEMQEVWLETLPQVRVYLFSESGRASPYEFFINSFIATNDNRFRLGSFMTPNTATKRLGKQAVWNVNGQDVSNVNVLDFGNYFQLQMPGQAYPEEFYDDLAYPQFSYCTPSDAWKRLVTISPLTEAPYQIAVGPSYRAVEAQPKLISVPGIASYDVFCGSNLFPHDGAGVFMCPDSVVPNIGRQLRDPQSLPLFPSFLLPSTSDYRIYNRFAVYDPDNLPTGGTQGTMYCGVGWFDYPPFSAEINVFMAGIRCPQEFSVDDYMLPSSRYMIPQNNSPLAYVAGAIEAARGLTSLTLLQPKPTPIFSAGKPFICGADHYFVGQSQVSA